MFLQEFWDYDLRAQSRKKQTIGGYLIFHRICKANFPWFSLHLWLAENLYKLTTIRGINDSTACVFACFLSHLCCIGNRSRICAKTFRP